MKPLSRKVLRCDWCRPHRGCNSKWKKYKTQKDKRHQNALTELNNK